ncbi:MAG: hypothetical protein IT340_13405 [Chloroflexi bacterium]|nr:hypothetical protein [Chloroflexota bacterium]
MSVSSNSMLYRTLVRILIGGIVVLIGFALLVGQDWLSMLVLLVVCTAGVGGAVLLGVSWVVGFIMLEVALAVRAAVSRRPAST